MTRALTGRRPVRPAADDDFETKMSHFIKDYFRSLCRTKCYYWKVFSPSFNNTSEQNSHDKHVLDNVNRFYISSLINNTVTNKSKTLSSIICIRFSNTHKMKLGLLPSTFLFYDFCHLVGCFSNEFTFLYELEFSLSV